jgi:hypothetical protein
MRIVGIGCGIWLCKTLLWREMSFVVARSDEVVLVAFEKKQTRTGSICAGMSLDV